MVYITKLFLKMPSIKISKEEQLRKQAERLEVLKSLYEKIRTHPLYDEKIIKMEQPDNYPTPKEIMEKVNTTEMTVELAIIELKQWIKILEILQDRAHEQRVQDIFKRNKDLLNEKQKKLDEEMNRRGLKF